jgi:hypothetical protein
MVSPRRVAETRDGHWATLAEEYNLLLVGLLCFVTSFAKITTMTSLVVTVGFDAFVWFATGLLAWDFCLFFGPLLLPYALGHGFRGDSRRPSRSLGSLCSRANVKFDVGPTSVSLPLAELCPKISTS